MKRLVRMTRVVEFYVEYDGRQLDNDALWDALTERETQPDSTSYDDGVNIAAGPTLYARTSHEVLS